MNKILCSTGALIGRPNGRDYRLLLPLAEQLSCDGLEFMMYSSWYEETKELLAELAKAYGADLLVENVVCSCKTPMEHLAELTEEYPEVHFVFDTKMAEFHRQLTLLYGEEYAWLWKDDHIRHYHVNDYAGGYLDWSSLRTLPIGSGQIDFERFFGYVRRTGYQGTYTVEATAFRADGSVDIEMLNGQFRLIASFL